MERVKRRWWTWAVSLLAAAVILGAVVSGAFQLAVLALPSYRADLSAWVTNVAGRPVEIGGVSLGWRGIQPRLDLSDITLFTQAGEKVLNAERLSLGFSVFRLVRGDALPYRIELAGLSLAVEIDADNRIRVRGFEHGGVQQDDWTGLVKRFRQVSLENCEVRLTDPRLDAQDWPFRLRRFFLRQSDRGFTFEGVMQPQARLGGELVFAADIEGALAQLSSWQGSFRVVADRVQPQGWLSSWLDPQAQIGAEDLGVRVEGRLAGGRLQVAQADAEAAALLVAHDGRSHMWQRLRARAWLQAEDGGGWRLRIPRLDVDDAVALRGAVRVGPAAPGGRALDADADQLALDALAPWLGIWRDAPPVLRAAARSGGQLQRAVLRLRPAPERLDYSLSARLQDLHLDADARFGFSAISGELSADANGGRLQLDDAPLQLQLPALLDAPLALDRVQTRLQWQRQNAGWRLQAPEFAVQSRSLQAQGGLTLDFGDGPPQLQLEAQLAAGTVTDAKPLMPRHWPEHLRSWLAQAIQGGRVSSGQLSIHGPLADFPYHRRPSGRWALDLDVADGRLVYAPDWPGIDAVAARLRFAGNGLAVQLRSGKVLDMPLLGGDASIDFNERVVRVRTATEGELARQFDFLRASPLHRPLSGLVENVRAAGRAHVDVALEIPLREVAQTRVQGRIDVDNAQMFYGRLDSPVTGIRGTIEFTEQQVRAEQLTARFEDLPLRGGIHAREGTHGVLAMQFPFTPRADGQGASKFIPASIREHLSGSSQWRAELPIRASTALELSSELQGLQVDLPLPLEKAADAALPLRLRIGGDAQAPVRLGLAYGQVLGMELLLAAEDGHTLRASGLHARFGGAAIPQAQPGRFLIDGRVPLLDLALVSAMAGGGDTEGMSLQTAELAVDRLRWRALETGPTQLRYAQQPGGWRLALDGETARGTLDWQREPHLLRARLQRLELRGHRNTEVAAAVQAGVPPVVAAVVDAPVIEPAHWPLLDVDIAALTLGEVALGHLRLQTAAMSGGQRVQALTLEGGSVALQLSGNWQRLQGQSSAQLQFDLDSPAVGGLLTAFGYAPNLDARRSRFSGQLEWSPSATGLAWTRAQGRIHADVENGQLRAVQPGGARVLGLINFYALPRRLTLNFKDVVGEGLGFDRLEGSFRLVDGVAATDDLDIEGPSLRMQVRGTVDLEAREYDQRVTVYPGVSSGVTLGAALLGGPAVGALVLLAQELLEKPLEQATQLSYRVTGSWDNPKIDRGDTANAAP